MRTVHISNVGKGKAQAEEMRKRKLVFVLAVSRAPGVVAFGWQRMRHHSSGSPHQTQREGGAEDGAPRDVAPNADVLSGQTANSSLQQVMSLKADG